MFIIVLFVTTALYLSCHDLSKHLFEIDPRRRQFYKRLLYSLVLYKIYNIRDIVYARLEQLKKKPYLVSVLKIK